MAFEHSELESHTTQHVSNTHYTEQDGVLWCRQRSRSGRLQRAGDTTDHAGHSTADPGAGMFERK